MAILIRLIPLLLLALPFVELAALIYLGAAIGPGRTLLLVVLSALLGIVLLRRQGLRFVREVERAVQAGRQPHREVFKTACTAIGAVGLIIPGPISDFLGLLLILPPVQGLVYRRLASGPARPAPEGDVIDVQYEVIDADDEVPPPRRGWERR